MIGGMVAMRDWIRDVVWRVKVRGMRGVYGVDRGEGGMWWGL